MKPARARVRRKQDDGTVVETLVEFKSEEVALKFFNAFRKKCGATCAPDPERDAAVKAVIARQEREAKERK